ncbi:hypothetical protein Poli38472_013610 [Pythium oligandrum]|uniref:Major facilitator superfamily (MFS) profile domain-containing protein n=1 Tax=Pythium oligandrum TaxID=41045 RepID=A0A8K1CDA6_PYTOL|nr:hypothetical protein Poli38472_013610 [Pythium oligandrum]|eukprot:TMW61147.1 hypothetical protein Poli38472_013610 [Pythium oligandrum]
MTVLQPLRMSARSESAGVSFMSLQSPSTSNLEAGIDGPGDEIVVDSTTVYALPVDPAQFDRATEIRPLSLMRPHMRVFHVSWFSAIFGFLGWYAIPPLMPVIKEQMGLTTVEILNSDIASTSSTIISRVVLGPLLELYGPQTVQTLTLWFGAIPIFAAAFVSNVTGLIIVRFFIGLVGCIFVSSQFWTSITFAKNVVGTSNAITGGLGLSGIGFAFLILPNVNVWLASSSAISDDLAWRITIALPAAVMLIMGAVSQYRADSCPMGEFHRFRLAQLEASSGISGASNSHMSIGFKEVISRLLKSFKVVLTDVNAYVLILHYGVSFGAELQLNNMGALYFYEEFLKSPDCNQDDPECHVLSTTHAALLASTFGLMNMFARALGGLASDHMNRRLGMRGRLVVQFFTLCMLGVFVIVLSRLRSLGPCIVLYILVAIAAQSAGGSSFSIVPYVNEAFTGTVTGLVGAGGNLGGVIYGIIFRMTSSRADGLLWMGGIILVSALFTVCIKIQDKEQRLR